MTAAELKQLRRDLDTAVSRMERSAGARDEILQQLKGGYDVDTVAEAERRLESLRAELEESVEKLRQMRDDFNERWEGKL